MRPPGAPDEAAGDWTKRRLNRLTVDLELDAAQRKRVAALLAQGNLPTAAAMEARKDEVKKHEDAILSAFEQGDVRALDAGKGRAADASAESPHDLIEREVEFLSQLLPILTPEQRETLAESRERHAPTEPAETDEPPPEAPPPDDQDYAAPGGASSR
jgi:Spy/CpxP family protein refolding chaperone